MREISIEEARILRTDGKHGFWSVWINPAVEHPSKRYVVCAGDRWFDMEPEEFKLEYQGITRMPVANGKLKQVHLVVCSVDDVSALIQQDSWRSKLIDIGAGVTTYHTDNLRPDGE